MTDDTALEAAAREHHRAYELLAPNHGYETREQTRVPWDELPANMRHLMLMAEGAAITAYNEAIGEKVGRSADEVISELGSDYVTNLSREREALRAENERLRDRIDSLRDGLVEIAAGDPDVTPAGLPTALRSRAKSTLDIDDEDAALHPQAITGKGGCDVCGSMSIEPHLPSCPVLHPQEGNDD